MQAGNEYVRRSEGAMSIGGVLSVLHALLGSCGERGSEGPSEEIC